MGLPSRSRLLLGIIVAVGAVLRAFRIGSESLWLDEGYSVHFVTSMSMTEIVLELPWMDNSPPLYYVLLDAWTVLFGLSETSIRSLSALFGICTIVVIYLVGRELYSERVGLLSAGFLSLSSFHVWYAQDARMYTLLALLTALSFLFLLRWFDDFVDRTSAVLYVIAAVAMGYTHVFGLFVIASQSAFVVGAWLVLDELDREAVGRWIAMQAAVGVLLVPYVRILLTRLLADGGRTWVTFPTFEYVVTTPLAYFATASVVRLEPIVVLGLLALVGGLCVVALSPLIRRVLGRDPSPGSTVPDGGDEADRGRRSLLLASWILVPTVVPLLVTYTITPMYVHRYTIGASIGLFVLVAAGIERLPRPSARVVAVVLLVALLVYPLPSDYRGDQKEQWRESAQYIEANATDGDVVPLNSEDLAYPFEYYFDSDDVTVTAASENTLGPDQRAELAESETVWLVLSHLNNAEADALTRSIDRTHTVADTKEYNDITVVKFVRE